MIRADQIPDEAINAYMQCLVFNGMDAAEAIAAAINSWPGVTTTTWFQDTGFVSVLNLPLPQTTRDVK